MKQFFYPAIFHIAEEEGFWVTFPDKDARIVIIQFDLAAYQRKHNSKAVKKTLSIPEWLNEEAIALGINFSQTLQEALIAKIQANS